MPSIPYQSSVDARTGRTSGARLRNAYDANALGVQSGRAMAQAGAQLEGVGDDLRKERIDKEREKTIFSVATFDPTPQIEGLKQTVDPDATGYAAAVEETYLNAIEDHVSGIDDDNVRTSVREQLTSQLPSYKSKANAYASSVQAETSKSRTNQVLYTLDNKVRTDPDAYDLALTQGDEAVDVYAATQPGPIRDGMKEMNRYNITKSRFEGKLGRAKTAAELDGVAAELQTPEWQGKLLPRDYEDLNNKISTSKKAYQTQLNSESKAVLSNLDSRSTDMSTFIPQEELTKANELVTASGDMAARRQLTRVMRNQEIVRRGRNLTVPQMKAEIEKNNLGANSVLPAAVAGTVTQASKDYDISITYLESMLGRESSELTKDNPNYGVKAPTSSATGLSQFVKKTWLGLVKDPAIAKALGVEPGMGEEAILALRANKDHSIRGAAILAKQNKEFMEPRLGRPVTDAELYMGHFLGAAGAVQFIQGVETDPNAVAKTVFPEAAAANGSVFSKDGKDYTLAEVYNNISRSFVPSTSRVLYEDNGTWQKMIDKTESALKGSDAMAHAATTGVTTLTPLDQPEGFKARSVEWETASNHYRRNILPLTTDEEAWMQRTIADGTAQESLSLVKNIQSMQPEAARATLDQLKTKSPAFAYAGMLALDGDNSTAGDIIRGDKRMKENPSMLKSAGIKDETVAADFNKVIGSSLSQIPPQEAEAIHKAAMAYYVESKLSRGGEYNSRDYENAVKFVTGGRVGKVNEQTVFLPKGISADSMEFALEHMTPTDFSALSVNGRAPLHANGQYADATDIALEAHLYAVGDDKYMIADSTGGYLITDEPTESGLGKAYVIDLKPEKVNGILERHRGNLQAYSARRNATSMRNTRFGLPYQPIAPGG